MYHELFWADGANVTYDRVTDEGAGTETITWNLTEAIIAASCTGVECAF